MAALTAPFDPAWLSRLGGDLTMLTNVQVTGTGLDLVTLDVVDGTVTYDEDTAPHVAASLSVRVPEQQATLDLLDARLRRRVEITTGYRIPGVSESHPLCSLLLRSRVVNRPSNLMTLTAVSDELLVQEKVPVVNEKSYDATVPAGEAIRDLIAWTVPDPTIIIDPAIQVPFVQPADSYAVTRGEPIWSAIQDIADRVGAWVYSDGLSTFHIVAQPLTAGPATAIFKVGAQGTITRSQADLNREEFANLVLVTYSWYDGEQRTARGWAEIATGPYSTTATDIRVKPVAIDRKGSAADAQAAAENIVRRTVTRGRGLSIEFDHAPWWVRPGHTVTVQLPTGEPARHLVRRVDFDIPSGRGHITTRQPEDVAITTGE